MDKSSSAIPVRRVRLNDPSELPSNLGTTPGGTLFSTTPGGTRLIYDRDFMLHCRNSPIAQTSPTDLPKMPGFSLSTDSDAAQPKQETQPIPAEMPNPRGDDHAFEMDL